MSANEITLVPQGRLVTWGENPRKESADAGGKRPKSTREFWISGTDDKTEAILAFAQVSPTMDQGVDLSTGASIVLFRSNVAPRAMGGGVWEATISYDSSSDTIDLSFTVSAATINIKQALADIKCYNCKRASSAATGTAADTATAAAGAAVSAADDIATAVTALAALIQNGADGLVDLLSAPGVDPATRTVAMQVASFATSAVVNANQEKINVQAVAANTTTATTEAEAGNASASDDAADSADAASNIATLRSLDVATDFGNAFTAHTTVLNGAGINAQTDAVVSKSAAVIVALNTLNSAAGTAATSAAAAAAAALAVAAAALADITPGGGGTSGVPAVNRAIGVSGDEVQGVDIEVGKVEFSITKKWNRATITAAYFQTVIDMIGGHRTPTNHATWSFTWLGITLVFPEQTVRFRSWSVKWTSENEVEITYNFAFERSITLADNFTVGNSGKITKLGQHYLWILFAMETASNKPMPVAQAVYVQQVYPTDDFNKLAI